MVNKLLSIIIPVYNGGKTIFNCLRSITTNFTICKKLVEIIIVDDGSTDNTICKIKKVKYPNLKIISKNNEGVSSARNIGIENSSGKFIWFIDSDDYLLKFDGQRLLDTLLNDKATDSFLFGFEKKSKENTKEFVVNKKCEILNHRHFIKEFVRIFDENEFNVPWNRIIKRSIIVNNGIKFDTKIKIGEDAIFNCKLVKYLKQIHIINKPLYVYNLFYSNKVKKYDSDLRFNLLKVNKSLKKLVITQKIDKSFYENKYERMNYSLLANLAEKYNNYYEFKKQLKNELLPYEKVNFIKLEWKSKIFYLIVKFDLIGYFLTRD